MQKMYLPEFNIVLWLKKENHLTKDRIGVSKSI